MSLSDFKVKCPCCGTWHSNEYPHKKLVNWCDYCIDKTIELQHDMGRTCGDCLKAYANCECEAN